LPLLQAHSPIPFPQYSYLLEDKQLYQGIPM
jgi:hypothetical protein